MLETTGRPGKHFNPTIRSNPTSSYLAKRNYNASDENSKICTKKPHQKVAYYKASNTLTLTTPYQTKKKLLQPLDNSNLENHQDPAGSTVKTSRNGMANARRTLPPGSPS